MAVTTLGNALTDRHRRDQVAIGAAAMVDTLTTWRYLDLADLDRSTPAWLSIQVGLMRNRQAESARVAAEYLTDFRLAETGSASGLIVRPVFNEAAAQATLLGNGPRLTKLLIGRGVEPEAALARASREVLGRSQKWALAGGRMTVLGSARANPRTRRWRRVSDGNPCAFCAMLLARSVGYGDQAPSFEAHRMCGCTAEEVYDDMPISELDSQLIGAYDEAAAQARAAGQPVVAPNRNSDRDTVLWRMRRNRPDLFSDGINAH